MTDTPADFAPSASWENLRRRAELYAQIRQFFDDRGFLEVETPLLSRETIVDRHLDPIAVFLDKDDSPITASDSPMWLQTSPEYGMKRLLAGGGKAIYQITRAFRDGEQGRLHNPEFTILEWYQVGDDMAAGIRLLDDLIQAVLQRGPAEHLSYEMAFRRILDIDPHRCSTEQLITAAKDLHLDISDSWTNAPRDDWLDLLLVSQIEPLLGKDRPTILFDYPATQAALAKIRDEEVPLAERFELYVDGIELANGYHELTDPDVLQRRAEQENRMRVKNSKRPLPIAGRLSAAMRHSFPDCAGVALGVDRLLLVLVGAKNLSEVVAFPIDRA